MWCCVSKYLRRGVFWGSFAASVFGVHQSKAGNSKFMLITTNQHGVVSSKMWIHIFGMHCCVKHSGCVCWKYFEAVCPVLSYCLMFLYILLSVFNISLYYLALGLFLLSCAWWSGKSTKSHLTLIFILYYQFSMQLYSQRIKANLLHNTPYFICS